MRKKYDVFERYKKELLDHNSEEDLMVIGECLTTLSVILTQKFGFDPNKEPNPLYGPIIGIVCDLNHKVFIRKQQLRDLEKENK